MNRILIAAALLIVVALSGCRCQRRYQSVWNIPDGTYTPDTYPAANIVERQYAGMTRPRLPFEIRRSIGAPGLTPTGCDLNYQQSNSFPMGAVYDGGQTVEQPLNQGFSSAPAHSEGMNSAAMMPTNMQFSASPTPARNTPAASGNAVPVSTSPVSQLPTANQPVSVLRSPLSMLKNLRLPGSKKTAARGSTPPSARSSAAPVAGQRIQPAEGEAISIDDAVIAMKAELAQLSDPGEQTDLR